MVNDRNSFSGERIARNTIMLYLRQILVLCVTLFTSRVILASLGELDYGIYDVVGGIVNTLSFLGAALSVASQRYLSFYMVREDRDMLIRIFSSSFFIYLLLSVCLGIFAETAGLWVLNSYLVIPDERMFAANVIYQFSILSFIVSLITTPFQASIMSHEDMDIYAYVSIITVLLNLLGAYALYLWLFDKLIFYGAVVAGVLGVKALLYIIFCLKRYPECRIRFGWNWELLRELASYSGWNLFGQGVGVAKGQLVNIALNIYGGPLINTGRGIAAQVNSAINSFAATFSSAVNPQIIKLYSAGKKEKMLELVFDSMRITYLLMCVLAFPVILNLDGVLSTWLETVPKYAFAFTKLTLIDAVIGTLSHTLGAAIQASGKIRSYQLVVGSILLLNFPLSVLALKLGYGPESTFYIAIFLTAFCTVLRLLFMKQLLNFSLRARFVRTNFARLTLCSIGVLVVLRVADLFLGDIYLFVRLAAEYALTAFLTFLLGLRQEERIKVIRQVKRRIRRLR